MHADPAYGQSPFLRSLTTRAAAVRRRIVLPEPDDPRTIEAATRLANQGLVQPVLVGRSTQIQSSLQDAGVGPELVEIRNPDEDWETVADDLDRQGVDISRNGGPERLKDPLWYSMGLVASGWADGCVAGAVHATANVIRAALMVIGKAPGITTISSAFYMDLPTRDEQPGLEAGWPLTFTDAGVVPGPTAEQLAEIAVSAARARRIVVGDEPRVAFLSYSTHGSASGPSVRVVQEALQRFRALMPDVEADGELQADAALVPEIRTRKAPSSPLTDSANVLVFPNLEAANIAYKLVQRLAGAVALGPILQGLRKPAHDLSRGASVEDIILVSCIAALEAEGREA